MNEDPESILHAIFHSGWAVALLASTWSLVLRGLVGRYQKHNERQVAAANTLQLTLDELRKNQVAMQITIARIEGQLQERAMHSDSGSWPEQR